MSNWILMPLDSAPVLRAIFVVLLLSVPLLPLSTQEPVIVAIPLTVNNEPPRNVEAQISQEQELIALSRSGAAQALAPVASESLIRKIKDGEGAWISRSRLEELGLTVGFDAAALAATARVPLDKTPRRDLSVLSEAREQAYPELAPAQGSGSLLLRTRLDHSYVEGAQSIDFKGTASPALALSTTTTEADIGVDTASDAPVTVDAMRFMADFLKPGIRLTVGDLNYPVRGLQSFVPTFGLSLHREDALLSSGDVQARGGSAVEISEPSDARFVVNGQTVRTERLEPGRYNLTDFPLLPGVNDVRVILENELGEETVIEDVLPFAPRLLPEGRYDYAGAIGFPRWEVTEPIFSGFYYRGFTERITAGLYAQASLDRQLTGLGSVLATRIGNVRLDLAGSRNESGRLAGSVLGEYRFALPARRWVPRVSLLGHYRHPAFTGVSAAGDTELPEWNLTATLAQPLPLGVGMNVSLRHQIFPTDRPEVTTLSGGLSRSVGRNASVTATAGASFSGGQTDWGARIVFSLSSSEPRTTVSVVQDVEAAETDVRVSQTRSTSIGRLTLAGSGSGLPPTTAGGKSVSATARLSNQRLETSLVQGFRFEEQDPAGGSSLTRTNTSLQFGTGVYFADGVPAMGRPARGGFVVTRAPADVPVDRVVLGTGSGTTQARTSWLGPAVLAGLSPYTSRTVNIDPVGLPVDYSLGPTTFTVEPGNRRGTVVPLEAEKRLYARGTLISAQGEEIALQALRVSAIEGPAAAREAMSEISSFTDESGTFELYDLYPGTYRVRVLDGSGRTTRVTIPEEGEVLVDLGRVELAAQEAEE